MRAGLRLKVKPSSAMAILKCLASLWRFSMRPTARAILSWPLGPVPRATWSASLANAVAVACSRSSRLRARSLARPFLGKKRVLAHDEPLAGKLGRGDLGQIAFVEQRELESAG